MYEMSEHITKLVVMQYETEKDTVIRFTKGYKYVRFTDPNTGKVYSPSIGFTVTGNALEDSFNEDVDLMKL